MQVEKKAVGRTFLFVDGTNLYAGQYQLFGPRNYLDFSLFIKEIESKLGVSFDKIYFYASYSPKPKNPTRRQKQYLKSEALFYKSVKNTKKAIFFRGYRSKASGKEKEVDVKLAVDIVDFAHRNYYENVYLLSGDADFMEALFAVRRLNKNIGVICLENKIIFKSFIFFCTYILILQRMPNFTRWPARRIRQLKIVKIDKEKVISLI